MQTWWLRRLRAAVHNWRSDCPYSIRHMLDHRNRALYKWVNRRAPILLSRSTIGTWEGLLRLTDYMGIVAATESPHPCASFTHELLHIKLELNGLIKPRVHFGVALSDGAKADLMQLCNAVCIDLAHHRMYDEFQTLGFPPNEFIGDEDVEAVAYVESKLTEWEHTVALGNPRARGLEVAKRFMVIHNPHDTNALLRSRLLAVANQEQIARLDQLLRDWNVQNSDDYCPYLVRFFQCCDMRGIGFQRAGNPIVWA